MFALAVEEPDEPTLSRDTAEDVDEDELEYIRSDSEEGSDASRCWLGLIITLHIPYFIFISMYTNTFFLFKCYLIFCTGNLRSPER